MASHSKTAPSPLKTVYDAKHEDSSAPSTSKPGPVISHDSALPVFSDDDDAHPRSRNETRDQDRERKRDRERTELRKKLRKIASPAFTLENSGSVARDHLANERTWLAYLRTSLAIASTGVALVQLFTISATSQANSNSDISILDNISSTSSSDNLSRRVSSSIGIELLGSENSKTPHIQRFARPLGGITVALAIVVLAIGAYRYFLIQHALTKGQFPPARRTMATISLLLLSIVIVVFGVLVGVKQA